MSDQSKQVHEAIPAVKQDRLLQILQGKVLLVRGPLSASVLNQTVSSGANFAFSLYLVHTITPFEFGLYGIGMAVCLLYAGIGNALFLTQMVVHIPDREDCRRMEYAASMFGLVFLFALITIGLVSLSWVGLFWSGFSHGSLGFLVWTIGLVSVSNLFRDYFVRLAYSISNVPLALMVNTVLAVVLGFVLFVVHDRIGLTTAATALWVYGAACLAATIAGIGISGLPLRAVRRKSLAMDFRQAFVGGRWAVGGVTVTWLQTQAYMYVTTVIVGPAGVAAANAARLLLAPFTFLLPALNQLLLPALVRLRGTSRTKLFQLAQSYTIFLIGAGALYLLVLWLGAGRLGPLIIGNQYSLETILLLAAAWGLVLLFQLARDGASLILQALKAFRALTLTNLMSALVAIAATLWLTTNFDVMGAILGVAVGEVFLAILLWRSASKMRDGRAS